MGEAPLSLHLEAKVMERLEHEAKVRDVATSDLARDVIEHYLEMQELERRILAERIAEADKGVFVSEHAMLDWMDRLDADPEAAPPEPDVFLPPKR